MWDLEHNLQYECAFVRRIVVNHDRGLIIPELAASMADSMTIPLSSGPDVTNDVIVRLLAATAACICQYQPKPQPAEVIQSIIGGSKAFRSDLLDRSSQTLLPLHIHAVQHGQ